MSVAATAQGAGVRVPARDVRSGTSRGPGCGAGAQINVAEKMLILSEQDVYRHDMLKRLRRGQVVECVVRSLVDYGAFVSLRGHDGNFHGSDARPPTHYGRARPCLPGSAPASACVLLPDSGALLPHVWAGGYRPLPALITLSSPLVYSHYAVAAAGLALRWWAKRPTGGAAAARGGQGAGVRRR